MAFNQITCSLFKGNTGIGRCNYTFRPYRYAILIPKGTIVTATNLGATQATAIAYIKSMLVNDNDALRWHAFGPISSPTANGEDRVQETRDDGSKITTRDSTNGQIYKLYKGQLCTAKNILDFENAHESFDVFYVDDKGFSLWEQTTDTTGQPALKGFLMDEFYPYATGNATYQNEATIQFTIMHTDAKGMLRQMTVFDLRDYNFEQVVQDNSIQNAILQNITPTGATAGVFTISLIGGCTPGDNLVALYGSTIINIARFAVTNAATGAAITFAVAQAATSPDIVFTLTTSDADYPTPPGLINFKMVAPSVLGAAGIKWYESNTLQI